MKKRKRKTQRQRSPGEDGQDSQCVHPTTPGGVCKFDVQYDPKDLRQRVRREGRRPVNYARRTADRSPLPEIGWFSVSLQRSLLVTPVRGQRDYVQLKEVPLHAPDLPVTGRRIHGISSKSKARKNRGEDTTVRVGGLRSQTVSRRPIVQTFGLYPGTSVDGRKRWFRGVLERRCRPSWARRKTSFDPNPNSVRTRPWSVD